VNHQQLSIQVNKTPNPKPNDNSKSAKVLCTTILL